MSSNTQNTQRGSRGRGGRGGGRGGRGGKKRKYKKWKEAPVKKKVFERCPFKVGSDKWVVWKNARYENNVFHSTHEVDHKVIPRTFKIKSSQQTNDTEMLRLQNKMIDGNWMLKNDGDYEYFEHHLYPGKKVDVHSYMASGGREIRFPFMDKKDDPEGIACSIVCINNNASIQSNEFTNYCDSRIGRRHANYVDYLDYRLERRAEFDAERKAIATANALNKKLANNV
jgi:hypothetical protein